MPKFRDGFRMAGQDWWDEPPAAPKARKEGECPGCGAVASGVFECHQSCGYSGCIKCMPLPRLKCVTCAPVGHPLHVEPTR